MIMRIKNIRFLKDQRNKIERPSNFVHITTGEFFL